MNAANRIVRLAVLAAVALLIVPDGAARAEAAELEIVNAFLKEFDYRVRANGQTAIIVVDACTRNGGAVETGAIPQVGSAGANNALLLQHVDWHAARGGFLEPTFTYADSDPYGREFLEFHRDLVATYTEWRAVNGYPDLAIWDPATPIPDAFAYDVAPPCLARGSDDPAVPLPTFLTVAGGDEASPFWGYTDLCSIPDANRLGKTIEGSFYHAAVHAAVGGDMSQPTLALRDPVFWAWHGYVQHLHEAWAACLTDDVPALDAEADQESSAPGLMLFAAALFVVAARRRR